MQTETGVNASRNSGPSRRLTGALFFVAAAVGGIGQGVTSSRGVDPGFLRLLFMFGFPWLLAFWIETDGERGKKFHVWDLGFFLLLSWIAVGPYYLLKTRGARGLLLLLGIYGTFFFSAVLGILLVMK